MKEHQAIHKFRRQLAARVFPARENDRSDEVQDAGTLSRPLATLTSFRHTLSLLDQYAISLASALLLAKWSL